MSPSPIFVWLWRHVLRSTSRCRIRIWLATNARRIVTHSRLGLAPLLRTIILYQSRFSRTSLLASRIADTWLTSNSTPLTMSFSWSTRAGPLKDQRERRIDPSRPSFVAPRLSRFLITWYVCMLHKITYELTILKLCGISNLDCLPSGMRWPRRSLYSSFVLIHWTMLFDYQSILLWSISQHDGSKKLILTTYFMRQASRTMGRLNEIRKNTKQYMRNQPIASSAVHDPWI